MQPEKSHFTSVFFLPTYFSLLFSLQLSLADVYREWQAVTAALILILCIFDLEFIPGRALSTHKTPGSVSSLPGECSLCLETERRRIKGITLLTRI